MKPPLFYVSHFEIHDSGKILSFEMLWWKSKIRASTIKCCFQSWYTVWYYNSAMFFYDITEYNISNFTYDTMIHVFIIYQCYVYRTNIRHIPPEVAWECDTTSVIRRVVIRWVWYDANFMGEKMLKTKFFEIFFLIFFLKFCVFELFFLGNFCLNFVWEFFFWNFFFGIFCFNI